MSTNAAMSSPPERRERRARAWSPIEDLPSDWRKYVDSSVPAMVAALAEQKAELRGRFAYDAFLQRLTREFAVETGAIEAVYQISAGATRTLIEKGLDAALISHEDTNESPVRVVEKIRDQHVAIEGIYQFVSSQRPLSKSYIRQLHQVVTEHQETYEARDTLGQFVTRPLPHGQWKTMPNNVEGPNGFRFEFCPPEQVESEMDRLLSLHERHISEENVDTLVEAAWLHHRFSLIHPFTDGNGRIARLLASAILLKAEWLPLVVRRTEKHLYLDALRAADEGDLGPLVALFGNLQRKVIRQALSLADQTLEESSKIQGILESIRVELEQQSHEKADLVKRAFEVGDSLQYLARKRLEELAVSISQTLRVADKSYKAWADDATSDDSRAGYYRHQIIQAARQLDYYANLFQYRAWAVLNIQADVRTEMLFSFHQVGHRSSGVLACNGMLYSKRTTDSGETEIGEVTPLSDSPFEFACGEEPDNVRRRFEKWLETTLVTGFKIWKSEIL